MKRKKGQEWWRGAIGDGLNEFYRKFWGSWGATKARKNKERGQQIRALAENRGAERKTRLRRLNRSKEGDVEEPSVRRKASSRQGVRIRRGRFFCDEMRKGMQLGQQVQVRN